MTAWILLAVWAALGFAFVVFVEEHVIPQSRRVVLFELILAGPLVWVTLAGIISYLKIRKLLKK